LNFDCRSWVYGSQNFARFALAFDEDGFINDDMNKLFSLVLAVWLVASCPAMAEEDFGLLIFNHRIAIGMTYGNVQAAWGKPRKVDRSTYSSGVREYWFFGDNSTMVVFENGRVVSIHD
jgi:hypothetical protein